MGSVDRTLSKTEVGVKCLFSSLSNSECWIVCRSFIVFDSGPVQRKFRIVEKQVLRVDQHYKSEETLTKESGVMVLRGLIGP